MHIAPFRHLFFVSQAKIGLKSCRIDFFLGLDAHCAPQELREEMIKLERKRKSASERVLELATVRALTHVLLYAKEKNHARCSHVLKSHPDCAAFVQRLGKRDDQLAKCDKNLKKKVCALSLSQGPNVRNKIQSTTILFHGTTHRCSEYTAHSCSVYTSNTCSVHMHGQ
jgi:hypothetical protein